MINGILVQIMMGSRLIYGMAREGLVVNLIGVVVITGVIGFLLT